MSGTFCSGTDAPVLVYKAFLNAVEQEWGGSGYLDFEHSFSCEVDPAKRAFLKDFFQAKHSFTNILDMETRNGQMFDETTDSWCDVPRVNWAAAGFPCDDASGLHPKQSTTEHRLCVAQVGRAKTKKC